MWRENYSMNNKHLLIVAFTLIALPSAYLLFNNSPDGPEAGIEVGKTVTSFSMDIHEGGTFILNEETNEVMVINFMATWCGSCVSELEILRAINEEVDGVTIVTVVLDTLMSDTDFTTWVNNKNVPWIVGHSPEAANRYKVTLVPTTIIVDRDGIIRERFTYRTHNELLTLISKYL
jgi:cytochrome c biogenesis protein CcmG/thiol:disulfide interchange protein DsbE